MFKNYFKLLVCLGVFVGSWLASLDVGAQNHYWTGGGASNDWNDPGNWTIITPPATPPTAPPFSAGSVPTDASSVIIDQTVYSYAGSKGHPQLTAAVSDVRHITFQNGGQLSLNGKEIRIARDLTSSNATPFADDGIVNFSGAPVSDISGTAGTLSIPRLGLTGASAGQDTKLTLNGINLKLTENAGNALFISAGTAGQQVGIATNGNKITISGGDVVYDGKNDNIFLGSQGAMDEIIFESNTNNTTQFNEVNNTNSFLTVNASLTFNTAVIVHDPDPSSTLTSFAMFGKTLTNNNGQGSSTVFASANNQSSGYIVFGGASEQFITIGANATSTSLSGVELSHLNVSGKKLTLNTNVNLVGRTVKASPNMLALSNANSELNVASGKELKFSPVQNLLTTPAYDSSNPNFISAASSGKITGDGLLFISGGANTVGLTSFITVETDISIDGTSGLYMSNRANNSNEKITLFFGGDFISVRGANAFTGDVVGALDNAHLSIQGQRNDVGFYRADNYSPAIQFIGDKEQTIQGSYGLNNYIGGGNADIAFSSVSIVGLPALEINKTSNNVVLKDGMFMIISDDSPTTETGNLVSFLNTSTSLSQLVIEGEDDVLGLLQFGTISDATGGKGEISGQGTLFISTSSFPQANAAAGFSIKTKAASGSVGSFNLASTDDSHFNIGANLYLGNELYLNGSDLGLGGYLFITSGTAGDAGFINSATGDDEAIVFTNSIQNQAAVAPATVDTNTDLSDLVFATALNNVVLQRDVILASDLSLQADGTGASNILVFDGGSFKTANDLDLGLKNGGFTTAFMSAQREYSFTSAVPGYGNNVGFISVFLTATGADQNLVQNTGNFDFSSVGYVRLDASQAGSSIDFERSSAGSFTPFGLSDVVISGGANATPIDASTNTDVQHVYFAGNFFHNGTGTDVVISTGQDYFVYFDVKTSIDKKSDTFLTVSSNNATLRLPRMGITGSKGVPTDFCTAIDFLSANEGLVIAPNLTVDVTDKTSTNIALALNRGIAFLSTGSTLRLSETGDVKIQSSSGYAGIIGPGTFDIPNASNIYIDPTGSQLYMEADVAWGGELELNGELAVAGNFSATIANSSKGGRLKLVGSKNPQYIDIKAIALNDKSGTGNPAIMGYLPNLEINKCDFTTATFGPTTQRNLYIDGNMDVNAGVYDLNHFITFGGPSSQLQGKFISASGIADAYGGSFLTISNPDFVTGAGVKFEAPHKSSGGGSVGTASQSIVSSVFTTSFPTAGTTALTTVYIPNVIIDDANVSLSNINLAVFGVGAGDFSGLQFVNDVNDPTKISTGGGNLNLGGRGLFITGGGFVSVRQQTPSGGGNIADMEGVNSRGTYAKSNSYKITNGTTFVTGAGTVLFMTGNADATQSRLTLNSLEVSGGAGVQMSSNILEITGNLTHNSFATAFITTVTNDAFVDMTSPTATITIKRYGDNASDELYLPALQGSIVNLAGSADFVTAKLVVGRGRADFTAVNFTSVLEVQQLNLGNHFLTISGRGGTVSGHLVGSDMTDEKGGVQVESFVTVTPANLYITSGLRMTDVTPNFTYTGVPPFSSVGRINVQENTLYLAGHLYDLANSFATASDTNIPLITGNSTTGQVIFESPDITGFKSVQFISSDGQAVAIMPNVTIKGQTLQLGADFHVATFDNVHLYLGGQGTANDKATLVLDNEENKNTALLQLNFNSTTFMTVNGSLVDTDHVTAISNSPFTTAKSIIGFGTVTFSDDGITSSKTKLNTDFGIEGDLFSTANAVINLNGKSLFLAGDYVNASSITKTFEDEQKTSTLVLSGGIDFQTISILDNSVIVSHSPVNMTEIPHLKVAKFDNKGGVQLGSNIKLYGNDGDALYLMTAVQLNGKFITVSNSGTQHAIYSEDANVAQLIGGDNDNPKVYEGLYVEKTTTQRSSLTLKNADVFIRDGSTLAMDNTHTLDISGDLWGIANVFGANDIPAASTTSGGASIVSSGTDKHGYVKFTSATELAFHTVAAVATVPALQMEIDNRATVFVSASPSNELKVASDASAPVLEFISGNMFLSATNLVLTGNGNNEIVDRTINNQVFVTADNDAFISSAFAPMYYPPTGSIEIRGTGFTTINVADDVAPKNTFATAWTINPGLSMRGTYLPMITVNKGNSTATVKLDGNLFMSALTMTQGDFELTNNNIQFMTSGRLIENLGSGHLVQNTGHDATYPTTPAGADYNGGVTGVNGVIFATGYVLTTNYGNDAPYTLGLAFNTAVAGSKVKVELRKDTKANGDDKFTKDKRVINRNYQFTSVEATSPSGVTINAAVMGFAVSELGLAGVSPDNLSLVRFNRAGATTDRIYTTLKATSKTTHYDAFNTALLEATAVKASDVLNNGYLTLGVNSVNIFHDANGVDDAEADEQGVVKGVFRLAYSSGASTTKITFKNTNSTATYGTDYFFTASSNNDAFLTVTPTGGDSYFVEVPAGTTETFLSVVPVDDSFVEGKEFVSVELTSVDNGYVLGSFKSAGLEILDDDIPGFNVAINGTPNIAVSAEDKTDKIGTTFLTVKEDDDDGSGKYTQYIGVNLRQLPAENTQVRMKISLSDVSEVVFAEQQPMGNYLITAGAVEKQDNLEIAFTNSTTPLKALNTDTYAQQWNQYVTVALRGKNDLEFDDDQKFKVSVEVVTDVSKTTNAFYRNPNAVKPEFGSTLKKAIVEGLNDDNEVAVWFTVNATTPAKEGTSSTIIVTPNVPVTEFVTVLLKTDNSKDSTDPCNLNAKRGDFTANRLDFAPGEKDAKTLFMTAVDNDFADGTQLVLITADIQTKMIVHPKGGIRFKGVEGENAISITVTDNDEVGFDESIDTQFKSNAGRLLATTKEADEKSFTYGFKLKSKPLDDVFVTVSVSEAKRVSLSSSTAQVSGSDIVFKFDNAQPWNQMQFFTAKVKDDKIQDNTSDVNVYLNTSVKSPCSEYAGKFPQSVSIKIISEGVAGGDTEVPTAAGDEKAPAKVSGVVVTPGSRQVVLNWAPNAEAGVLYQVYVYQLGQPKRLAGETTATSFTVTGLTNGVEYVFEVVAIKKDATGKVVATGSASDNVTARPSIILGTEKAKVATLDVYPNPSKRLFNVRLVNLNAEQLEVKVLSVTGQEIYSKAHGTVSGEFETAVDLDGMPAGMYVLIVNTDNGSFRTKLVLTR